MIERRETDRRRVCLGGSLRVAVFMPEIACSVHDVSLAGARIRIDPAAILPARLELSVPCRAETHRARLVWRAGDMAGLSFEEDARGERAPIADDRSHPSETPRPGRLH